MNGKQTFIVRLEPLLARRVRQLLSDSGTGYGSLDEFVEVALLNQLTVEERSGNTRNRDASTATAGFSAREKAMRSLDGVLARPETSVAAPLSEAPPPSNETLWVLTNRLGPIKVAARVLANQAAGGNWPLVERFQETAAAAARTLGVVLRSEDEAQGRKRDERRWVAFPVGKDERAAVNRFISSFAISADSAQATGPLALLGLVNVLEERAVLTEEGWALAQAASPLIDGAPGWTLSDEEQTILKRQLFRAPGERAATAEFLEFVSRTGGSQERLDEFIAAKYPDWSSSQAVAHRSAMIGRLRDLAMLDVTGWGAAAHIQLLISAEEFLEASREERLLK